MRRQRLEHRMVSKRRQDGYHLTKNEPSSRVGRGLARLRRVYWRGRLCGIDHGKPGYAWPRRVVAQPLKVSNSCLGEDEDVVLELQTPRLIGNFQVSANLFKDRVEKAALQ
jgi:hypothetical protein